MEESTDRVVRIFIIIGLLSLLLNLMPGAATTPWNVASGLWAGLPAFPSVPTPPGVPCSPGDWVCEVTNGIGLVGAWFAFVVGTFLAFLVYVVAGVALGVYVLFGTIIYFTVFVVPFPVNVLFVVFLLPLLLYAFAWVRDMTMVI